MSNDWSERYIGMANLTYWSEAVAAAFLRQSEFSNVRLHETLHGPDIICEKAGRLLFVEVKAAYTNGSSWMVTSVYPNRRGDDFVAIVLPGGKVILDSMRNHLAAYGDGPASVTALVREHCPEIPWSWNREINRQKREINYCLLADRPNNPKGKRRSIYDWQFNGGAA